LFVFLLLLLQAENATHKNMHTQPHTLLHCREHYAKFLAVGLVWHTAAELLLAAIDAQQLGCEAGGCGSWALVACVVCHVALAYGNKKPVRERGERGESQLR